MDAVLTKFAMELERHVNDIGARRIGGVLHEVEYALLTQVSDALQVATGVGFNVNRSQNEVHTITLKRSGGE